MVQSSASLSAARPELVARAADIAVRECLAVKAGEEVLVVTDEVARAMGVFLWEAARRAGAEASLLEMLPRQNHGQEPPAAVAAAMRATTVSFLATSRSLSHTEARRAASAAGARIASMPEINAETMVRAVGADCHAIARDTVALAQALAGARSAQIRSPAGTDLALNLSGRRMLPDAGLYHSPGDFGNLPAGEVFGAPVEGSAAGVIVIDGSISGIGRVDRPVRVEVSGGLARSIEGGEAAARLRAVLDRYGEAGRNVAELGIGTNSGAAICGVVVEDEKVLGTAHIAFGSNDGFGGTVRVPVHIDVILLQPTLVIDGREVLKDGRLVSNDSR